MQVSLASYEATLYTTSPPSTLQTTVSSPVTFSQVKDFPHNCQMLLVKVYVLHHILVPLKTTCLAVSAPPRGVNLRVTAAFTCRESGTGIVGIFTLHYSIQKQNHQQKLPIHLINHPALTNMRTHTLKYYTPYDKALIILTLRK